MKCQAAIATGTGDFVISEIKVGSPEPDEVLVQIKAAGLCHTDYDSLNWGKPIVMGHEGAGKIVEIGSAITKFKKGDRVVLNWATPCGECFQCTDGNEHLCERNSPVIAGEDGYTPGHAHLEGTKWEGKPIERSFNLGTFSEYTLVKESALVAIDSPGISDSAASLISCSVMTGYGSAMLSAKVKRGSSVVVLGCGSVGLNVIQGARIAGAKMIIAVDINYDKLEEAKLFGATQVIQADKHDDGLQQVARQIKEITDGRGADFAFECTAIPALGAAPLAMVRNAGTAVQVSGIEEEVAIDMELFEWDKKYINPLYGGCCPSRDFPDLMRHYDKGDLLLDELISKHYDLKELDKAFDDLIKGRIVKGVITF